MVEDDIDWRNGLADFLNAEEDLTVIGTAGTKQEALAVCRQMTADIILLDINLTANQLDGIEVAMTLQEQGTTSQIIMLTSLQASEIIVDSFSAGAINYISKSNFREIPEAIRSAHRQQSAIHPTAAAALREELQRLKNQEAKRLLSPAEKEILKLVHQGQTQSQIEQTLHITQRTIKNHINRILKKLGVKSSKEAAAKAKQKRLF
nr:response regulator transcription factor [Brevibacillus fulvus]